MMPVSRIRLCRSRLSPDQEQKQTNKNKNEDVMTPLPRKNGKCRNGSRPTASHPDGEAVEVQMLLRRTGCVR